MADEALSGTDLAGRRSTGVLCRWCWWPLRANSLITRHVVGQDLLDARLLSRVRFIAGAAALLGLSLARSERPVVGRANLLPALWLGVYAVCISYGYLHIGAAAGTFVFYAGVLLTLVAGSGRVQGLLRRWRPGPDLLAHPSSTAWTGTRQR